MKYGTILRAVRIIFIIFIVATLIVPLVGSIASTNAEKMTAGIESRYDLEAVNDSPIIGVNMIEVNLNQIIEPKDTLYIGIDDDELVKYDNIDEAAQFIIDKKSAGAKIASIYDVNKNICHQSAIQYHNGITTTAITGFKLPDNVMGLASFSVDLRLVSEVANFDIPFGESYIEDGYMYIKTEIPDLVMFLANSIDHVTALKVNVTVMGIASFYVNVNMLTEHSVNPIVKSDHEIQFQNAAIGSYVVEVGSDVIYTYDSNTFNIVMKHTSDTDIRPLSESIKLDEATGNIIVHYYNESGPQIPKEGHIDGKYYEDIIDILRYLEGSHV